MKTNTIDYFDAFNLLFSVSCNNDDIWRKDELAASVTHWIHSPESKPILLPDAYKKKFKDILINYNMLKSDQVKLDNLIKNSMPNKKLSISYQNVPFPQPLKPKFTFIDLFAGIGGFRLALQKLGGKCVFSCEWDNNAKKTYFNNFGEVPFGNIKQFTNESVSNEELGEILPDFDILAAGFPCQPFSRAGVSARKSLGQSIGFDCEIQGTLFFDIVRIIIAKSPDILFLEHVKCLKKHDGVRTFDIIKLTIEELGYSFNAEIIDSSTVVPQRRKRCYIVCFKGEFR